MKQAHTIPILVILLLNTLSATAGAQQNPEQPASTPAAIPLPGNLATIQQAYQQMEQGQVEQACQLLQETATQQGNNPWLFYHLGVCYHRMGNLFFAQNALQGALELRPQMQAAHHLMGLLLLEMEDNTTAAEMLEAADRDQQPGTRQALLVAQGLTAFEAGELDGAVDLLEAAGDLEDPTLADVAMLYTQAIYGMKGFSYKPVELALSSTARYDSNVILEPTDPPAWLEGENEAFGASLAAALAVRPLRGTHVVEGWLRGYRTFYASQTADDFNMTWLGAGVKWVTPRYAALDVGYDFSLMFLDGGPRVEQEEMYVFQESHGTHLSAELLHTETFKLVPRYSVAWQFHDTARRDVMRHALDLNLGLFLADGRLKLFFIPQVLSDTTLSPNPSYDVLGYGGQMAASALLEPILLTVRGGGLVRDYYNSTGRFGTPDARQDTLLRAGMQVAVPLWEQLSLLAGADYWRNLSTIGVFDYQRFAVTLGVNWSVL